MERLKVKTNLHCDGCIDKIEPFFNHSKNIHKWRVDLKDPGKTISIEGRDLSTQLVNDLLNQEGYAVIGEEDIIPVEKDGFWESIKLWKRASFNTLNCLIGCSIGDFGMIIYLQAFYPNTSMLWQMILAIIAGLMTSILLETIILKTKEHFSWPFAFKTALGMSLISMIGMEIAMNTSDFIITGGKAAFDDPMYWIALLIALVAGFIAPLPYNYYKLKKFNQACH